MEKKQLPVEMVALPTLTKYCKKAKYLSTTAKKKHKFEYIHDEIGFNLRLSNINAALGCAQLKKLNLILKAKREFWKNTKIFKKFQYIKVVKEPNTQGNYWLICLKFEKYSNIKIH